MNCRGSILWDCSPVAVMWVVWKEVTESYGTKWITRREN